MLFLQSRWMFLVFLDCREFDWEERTKKLRFFHIAEGLTPKKGKAKYTVGEKVKRYSVLVVF